MMKGVVGTLGHRGKVIRDVAGPGRPCHCGVGPTREKGIDGHHGEVDVLEPPPDKHFTEFDRFEFALGRDLKDRGWSWSVVAVVRFGAASREHYFLVSITLSRGVTTSAGLR